ncbi:MAG: IS5/IS1182 family transposase [Anaerolineae bacterium]
MYRLELAGETMRRALNSLEVAVPGWLRDQVPLEWFDRHGQPFSDWRLPKSQEEQDSLAETIGRDGLQLFEILRQSPDWSWLRTIPAVEILRQVWRQQYWVGESVARWRKDDTSSPTGQRIASPYDPDARYATKRTTHWKGYNVHLAETPEADFPLLITNVETTSSATDDYAVTQMIHQHLNERNLRPAEHLLDAGYMHARGLVESKGDRGVDQIGPVRRDPSWQAKAGEGFDLACFAIDWKRQSISCPRGRTSVAWQPHENQHGELRILARFAASDCRRCPARAQYARSQVFPRALAFHPRAAHCLANRASAADHGRIQAGVCIRCWHRRRRLPRDSRVWLAPVPLRRLAKTHLQYILTAAAINLARMADWLEQAPWLHTRRSRFATLARC